jgi:hypothetical protein
MGNQRFLYDKIVREGSVSPIVLTDYHPDYPVSKVQNIWTDYAYRSKYGASSGWGYFKITTSNQWVDFDEGGSELNAQLTVGDYDADTLCTEIKTRMEAVGAYTYNITYEESLHKFRIQSPTGNFTLRWSSGTHSSTSVGDTIGFDVTADDTGLSLYTADYVRIHTSAAVVIDSLATASIATKACAVYGLNLTATPQAFKLQRYTTSWVDVATFDYDSTNKRAICFYTEVSDDKYRIYIEDRINSDYYIQVGAILLGDYEELSRGYEYGASSDVEDSSEHMYSKKGYITVAVGYRRKRRAVVYEVLDADEQKLDKIFNLVGKEHPFVFVADSAQAKETMEYGIFSSRFTRRKQDNLFWRVGLVWDYGIK